jgi:lipid A ethanolaminephosphotransferase
MRDIDDTANWHPTTLLALLALWLATAGNWPLWLEIQRLLPGQDWRSSLTLISWIMALAGATLFFLTLWVWPRWLKPVGLLLLLASASSNYFIYTYRVVIDPTMIANVIHTDAREAADLLSPGMLLFLAAGFLLPGWWWLRQPVRSVSTGQSAVASGEHGPAGPAVSHGAAVALVPGPGLAHAQPQACAT